MDTLARLTDLLNERGWTEYRLAQECGLAQSTIGNIFRRGTEPTLSTLETLCKGFGISLSQFFADGEMIELTPELQELTSAWFPLSPTQKAAALHMLLAMREPQ